LVPYGGNHSLINFPDFFNHTTLTLATLSSPVESVDFLLKLGTDPNIKDDTGTTAFQHAATFRTYDNLKATLEGKAMQEMKANLVIRDAYNRHVLARAAMDNDETKFKLIMGPVSIGSHKEELEAAIHPRFALGNVSIVKEILASGGSISESTKDRDGWTVADIALASGEEDMLTLFEETFGHMPVMSAHPKERLSKWSMHNRDPGVCISEDGLQAWMEGMSTGLPHPDFDGSLISRAINLIEGLVAEDA
jgi:ankyrin repeat protein